MSGGFWWSLVESVNLFYESHKTSFILLMNLSSGYHMTVVVRKISIRCGNLINVADITSY